ncbi:MAG: hypothetical protein RLZZ232_119 [Planctomycetota bacterium]
MTEYATRLSNGPAHLPRHAEADQPMARRIVPATISGAIPPGILVGFGGGFHRMALPPSRIARDRGRMNLDQSTP